MSSEVIPINSSKKTREVNSAICVHVQEVAQFAVEEAQAKKLDICYACLNEG